MGLRTDGPATKRGQTASTFWPPRNQSPWGAVGQAKRAVVIGYTDFMSIQATIAALYFVPTWIIAAVVAGVISAVILLGWAFSPHSRPRD